MTTTKNLSKKNLLTWVLNNQDKFTQGNNLQETQLEISLQEGILKAEFVCRNGLGSIFSTGRFLVIECPDCFVHLFMNNSIIEFDI